VLPGTSGACLIEVSILFRPVKRPEPVPSGA
jgi:hypothetical protein